MAKLYRMKSGSTIAERFEFYSIPEPNSGCTLWFGTHTGPLGYGQLGVHGKMISAHRLAWELKYGPIPKGKVIRHTCDNPPCVNPDHLEIGTHQNNSDDMVSRERNRRGVTHHMALLSDAEVIAIRAATGFQWEIGERFGVSQSTVHLIKARKIWRHLP